MKKLIFKSVENLSFIEEQRQRQSLALLIDVAFEEYLNSGRPLERYPSAQRFLSLLFQTVNETPETGMERVHALNFCVRVVKSLILYYQNYPFVADGVDDSEQKAAK